MPVYIIHISKTCTIHNIRETTTEIPSIKEVVYIDEFEDTHQRERERKQ